MNISKPFWTIMGIFFIIFISIFISSSNGYYEYKNKEDRVLTDEKIKEFEQDIKENKNVDIKNYYVNNEKEYNNKMTRVGEKISYIVTNSISKGLEGSFKLIEKLVE